MASIPLAALAVKAPEQVDTLGQYGKLLALKGMLQNQQFEQQDRPLRLQAAQQGLQQQQLATQQQQQAIDDQHATTQAMLNWDGKNPTELQKMVLENHGSGTAALALSKHFLDIRNETATAIKNEGEGALAKAHAQQAQYEQIAGQITSFANLPDEQLPQALLSTAQQLDPQHAQGLQSAAQLSPAQIRKTLPAIANGFLGYSAQIEAGLKDTENKAKLAQIPGMQAESEQKQAQAQALQSWLKAHPGKTQADFEVSQAGKTSSARAFGELGAQKQLEKFKIEQQRQLLPPELQTVAPQMVPAAASQYEKASTEYAGAKAAQDEMSTIIADAKSGNKVAYAYAPTTGVLTINSANGVKRVNMAEIRSYSNAGSVVDRIAGFFGKQISGASIPDDILNDMQQVHDDLGRNSAAKYSNQVQATNATYGNKFKPQEFTSSKADQGTPIYDPKGNLAGYSHDGGKTYSPVSR